MSDSSRKRKRKKIRCLECSRTFDDDYRKTHNKQSHQDLIDARKNIRFEEVGAPQQDSFFSLKSAGAASKVI